MKSVSEYVNDAGLDVVVFSLSLTGKHWSHYMSSITSKQKDVYVLEVLC